MVTLHVCVGTCRHFKVPDLFPAGLEQVGEIQAGVETLPSSMLAHPDMLEDVHRKTVSGSFTGGLCEPRSHHTMPKGRFCKRDSLKHNVPQVDWVVCMACAEAALLQLTIASVCIHHGYTSSLCNSDHQVMRSFNQSEFSGQVRNGLGQRACSVALRKGVPGGEGVGD